MKDFVYKKQIILTVIPVTPIRYFKVLFHSLLCEVLKVTATIIKTKLRYLWVRKVMFFFCNLCYAQLF